MLREPREARAGRLRSQIIDGEEYPEFLFAHVASRRHALTHQARVRGPAQPGSRSNGSSPRHRWSRSDSIFAVGLEHGNSTIGHTMFNIVFMREHNRIADILAGEHPDWDDTRVFETTRNIMIVVFLKLVIEEYIKHIGPSDFPIELVPYAADKAEWNRQNWMTIEFNLLYRWHSMVPEQIGEGENALEPDRFRQQQPARPRSRDRAVDRRSARRTAPGRSACTTRPRS